MPKDYSVPAGVQRPVQRRARAWRSWFWGVTSWLKNGAVIVAFYLASRANVAGVLAVIVFVSGLLLEHVLEATSQGD